MFRVLFICIIVVTDILQAQTTSVTFQVIDADSQTWNNGSWTASLYSPPNVPCCNYVILGTATVVPSQIQTGSLDASGNGSLTVTPNTSISPVGTRWLFSFCPAATIACVQQIYTIGPQASQVLGTGFPAIRISAQTPNPRLAAYTNTEIVGGLPGTQYWNLIDASVHVCSSLSGGNCVWSIIGTAGGVVPVGVSNGAALVSNGVSNPPVYQTKPVIDVRDFGVVGNASTDDTTALQNAINSACPLGVTGSKITGPPTLRMKVTSTISFTKCWGIYFDLGQGTGEANGATTNGSAIIWAGAVGGTVMALNQTRDSTFKNFSILTQTASGGNNANIGLDIDENGAVTTITSNNVFQNIAIRSHDSNTSLALIRIGANAPANVERQIFEHLTLDCSDNVPTVSNNGKGILFGGGSGTPQINRIKIHDVNTLDCSSGITITPGGSADIVDIDLGDFSNNFNDLTTGASDNHVTYRNIRSEICTNPIIIAAGNSNALILDNLSFSGCTGTLFTLPANGSRTIRMTNIKSDNIPTAFSASTSNVSYSIFADNNVWPSGFSVDPTFFPLHFPNGWVSTRNFSFTSPWPTQLNSISALYNSTGVAQSTAHIVVDRCTLGTNCSVTLTGASVFTSSTSYNCVAIDRTGANAVQFVPSSGSAFALTGTGTDLISYICAGN